MITGMLYILCRYLHFLAILGLAGSLVIENMAMKPTINGEDIRNLVRVDAVHGISAVLVLLFGLVLWFGVGKPATFYSANPLFLAKLGLFLLIALLAGIPALFYLGRQRSNIDDSTQVEVPRRVRVILKLELIVLAIIFILAFLMARGIGLPS